MSAKKAARRPGAKGRKVEPRDLLVADGYNILRSSGLYLASPADGPELEGASLKEGFEDYADGHYNTARDALINDIAVFAHRRYDAVIVFDAAGNPSSEGKRSEVAGVRVIFSAVGVSADTTIEDLVHKAVDDGRNVLVITSDATLQWTVLGKRVTRMSAAGFADEMCAIRKATVNDIESVSLKNTLAERLDEGTRSRLARMARGME